MAIDILLYLNLSKLSLGQQSQGCNVGLVHWLHW